MSSKRRAQSLLVTAVLTSFASVFLAAGCASNGGGVGGALTRVLGQAFATETDGDQKNNDGDVEISGLYNPDQATIEKDLDPATSIACIAGISAINDGSITEEHRPE